MYATDFMSSSENEQRREGSSRSLPKYRSIFWNRKPKLYEWVHSLSSMVDIKNYFIYLISQYLYKPKILWKTRFWGSLCRPEPLSPSTRANSIIGRLKCGNPGILKVCCWDMREDEDAVRSHTQFCAGCKVGALVFRSFPVLSAKFLKFSTFFSQILLL